ncbi:MAG: T9SS type A sorting domain-containing protein [Fibrobacteres bacterium]|nr:T9SS type A sorting domain-containing protein [Fibrobacterota bacterium]
MKKILITILFVLSGISLYGEVTFTTLPKKLQFFARNAENSANVLISGSAIGSDSVTAETYKNGVLIKREVTAVSTSNGNSFSFSTVISAGLFSYRIVIRANNIVAADIDSILCGDAFIGAGQSNMDYSQVGYNTPWLRTFGSQTITTDSVWHNPGKTPYNIGREIIEEKGIPVCFIVGSVGGTSIVSHQPDTTNSTIYGRLYNRVKQAGLKNGIKAIFWNQGEFDTGDSIQASTQYQTFFNTMYNGWKKDYPGFLHVYTFQLHPCDCCGDWQGLLRETQRLLPTKYTDLSVLATAGTPGHDGCHFLISGANAYEKMGEWLYPQVRRDLYGSIDTIRIKSPNISKAFFLDGSRTKLKLEFDQPIQIPSATLRETFLMDGKSVAVDTAVSDTSHNTIILSLRDQSKAKTVSYTPAHYYAGTNTLYTGPWLWSSKGLPVLTFNNFPLSTDSCILLDTGIVDFYLQGTTTIPVDPILKVVNNGTNLPPLTALTDSSWLKTSITGSGNNQVIHHYVTNSNLPAGAVCTVKVRINALAYKEYTYKVIVRNMNQSVARLEPIPNRLWVAPSKSDRIEIREYDNLDKPVANPAKIAWSINNGGAIDSNGIFVSNGDTGTFTITAQTVTAPIFTAKCTVVVSEKPYTPYIKRINFEPDTIPPRAGWFANNGMPCLYTSQRGFGWVGVSHFMMRDDRKGSNYLLKSFVSYTSPSKIAPYRISAPDGDYIIRTAMGDNAWGITEVNWTIYNNDTICFKPSGLGNAIKTDTITVRGGKGIDLLIKGAINYIVIISKNGVDMDMVADDSVTTTVYAEKSVNISALDMNVLPNPFNPSTAISITLPSAQPAILSVYDACGRLVENINEGILKAGTHRFIWDAADKASGIYFISFKAGNNRTINTKALLLR